MFSCVDDQRIEDMPVNPDTLSSRFEEDNYPVYKDFSSFFVSGVVGIRHFDRNKCHMHYRKYVTVSDEAFTVLTLENNWTRWSSMAESGDWKESEEPSKWTTTKDKRNHKKSDSSQDCSDDENTPQARRYRGWSAQGIARYNQLFMEIKKEREKEEYSDFEEYCIDEFQEEAEAQGKTKRKRKSIEPERQMPDAKNELWADDNLQDEAENGVTVKFRDRLKGLIGV
jgi:hypothetical protein